MTDRVATPVAGTAPAGRLDKLPAPQRGRRRNYGGIALWVALVITSLLWFLPFFIMFLTSVKSNADISATAPWALPTSWAWENYAEAFETGRLGTTGLNSLVISLVKVPIGLMLAAAAAFAIARLRFRAHRIVLGLIAIGSMVPIQIALGPLFSTMLQLGALDSLPGLVLPYLAFGIPYAVFVLYGFFRAIPDEIEESARMDGASTFRIFIQVILPLAKPALAALFILDFVGTWNEYAMATTLLRSQENWTVPLAVQSFSTQHGTDYGPLNAFIIMSAVPVLIVYLMFQRYFVQGALAGAVKG
ncbi:raffinose/stachyose/melibiose transport system permease protein [Isoptericola variabilis J7]|uniref:ABC-type transporter, integral membrane subunit n=1 Tax=Isoptericola variabilis (strain 225) TaxID=743718 RepID=F6FW06_ISOV2|nr:carbohydrate ABC transporter permease [Isoptericola variabilis]AEG44476.1 ABC-type transporter, integral membrane subunit [Isoptericola variabilis 225]TWH26611.1 raffinose/stachyose/melibiose transport system permease protein [Isoptericola variabilis J7]